MATGIPDVVVPKPRDDDFYFTLITFEVEGILFRVPRHPFELGSEVFRDMLSLPSTDTVEEGTSDEKPLNLHGISVKDFRALLRVLLDTSHIQKSDLTQEEWTSVLRLSHIWNFDQLFSLAIEKLDRFTIDPVTKIILARSYGIFSWLRPTYFDLAMRTEPPTMEEADRLGMEIILKLAKIRERRYKWIIENEEIVRPNSTLGTGKGKKSRLLEPRSNRGSTDDFIKRHEAAVHVALSEIFGLEQSEASTADVPPSPAAVFGFAAAPTYAFSSM